jgi:hypothetical protein
MLQRRRRNRFDPTRSRLVQHNEHIRKMAVWRPPGIDIPNDCVMNAIQTETMSTIGNLLAATREQATKTSALSDWRICAFILLLFIVAATLSAMRKDVTRGFDEVAHVSYIAQLQKTGEVWPHLNEMRMLDPLSFHFTGVRNYLNHPPFYYELLAHIGPNLEGHPQAIIVYRLLNVALAASGLAALLAIQFVVQLPRLAFYAYVVPLACIPVLAPIAGAVNNDNAAFAGGGIATLAAFKLLSTGTRARFIAALCGLVIAAWAKLTGLLLVGGMIGCVLAWLFWQQRLPYRWGLLFGLAAVLASVPYIVLFIQYGSPTPNTLGQIAMVKTGAHAVGWDSTIRMSPIAYVIHFVSVFVLEWMPSLESRSALNYAALSIPVVATLLAIVGLVISARRVMHGSAGPLDIVVVSGGLAFAATLAIHCAFGYERHIAYGWMLDAYPRYYLPLAAIIPFAGISLLSAIKSSRARAIFTGFLILGPIVFWLIGAPLSI